MRTKYKQLVDDNEKLNDIISSGLITDKQADLNEITILKEQVEKLQDSKLQIERKLE